MQLKATFAAVLLAMSAAGAANATILTFDNLSGTYGDGWGLGANMTVTSDGLHYTENGYVFTVNVPNSYPDWAHIGDSGSSGTYNWHDDGNNGVGAYVTLKAANGGLFNLIGFDYRSYGFTVSAAGHTSQVLSNTGHASVNFYNVSSVTFSSTGYIDNQLDNVELTNAVPEPGSFALLGLGLLGVGAMRRKAAKK